MNDVVTAAQKRMTKSIESLVHDLARVRTGRASAGVLEPVLVPYYGNDTPLNQVASVSASDARTLTVTPWEKSLLPAVEKAILNANLGLNPVTVGEAVRVPMPPLTEERRRDLIKQVKATAEGARVAVRNIRRDGNAQLKEDKSLSEDDVRKLQESMQKSTDHAIAEIDRLLAEKETDLLSI